MATSIRNLAGEAMARSSELRDARRLSAEQDKNMALASAEPPYFMLIARLVCNTPEALHTVLFLILAHNFHRAT